MSATRASSSTISVRTVTAPPSRQPRRAASARPRAGLDAHGHAALARRRGLAQQQRHEHGLLDALAEAAEQILCGRGLRSGELDGLLGTAQLDEPGDHVEAVRGLVRLGAQGVSERADGAQLARQRLDLRAVAQRHHRADAPAVAHDRA
jgi:hypothetical protein